MAFVHGQQELSERHSREGGNPIKNQKVGRDDILNKGKDWLKVKNDVIWFHSVGTHQIYG